MSTWKQKALGDLSAGITTGILAIPQGMAFAILAGVPPECGLYAMIVPTIVAALIRSSPYLITGATNTSALVIGATLASLPAAYLKEFGPVRIMLLITCLMGLLQIGAGLLRLGGVGRFFSIAVLTGFTTGAAVLILVSQLKHVLGLSLSSSPLLIDDVRNLLASVSESEPRALALAAVTLGIIWRCGRVSRLIPGTLIALAVASLAVHLLGWKIACLASFHGELPQLQLPAFSTRLLSEVWSPSVAIAILGMVEAISIGKALSAKTHTRFYANRELIAKGGGNIAGAFFGCMPTSASWTRSAVNLQMGAQTRWVGVISGVTVLLIMLLLAPFAQYVPTASLGAIVVWIAILMIDPELIKRVWRWGRKDALVMLITFLAVLFMEIQYAIYFGVAASFLLLIYTTGKLHLVEILRTDDNRFYEQELTPETGSQPLVLLQLEGDLFFAVVDELEERLDKIAANGAKVVVIRMKRLHAIDVTANETLADFAARFQAGGGRLILCGLNEEMLERLKRSRLAEVLGAENLLVTGQHLFESLRSALELVKKTGVAGTSLAQSTDDCKWIWTI